MRLSVVFILSTALLDAMGIGLVMPIMPDLIREVEGGDLSDAALWGGILATIFAVMQFLFGPVLGNLSDAVGRRPVLLVSLAAMALVYLLMAVAGSIWVLFAARMFAGVTAATHSTAAAWMADTAGPGDKAARFGLLGAAFGTGFVLGPLVGGMLGALGTRAPFYAAAGLAVATFLLGLMVMRETVPPAARRRFDWRRANPAGAFLRLTRLPAIRGLALVYFVYSVALYVYPAIWSYFTQAQFGWTPQVIGLSLGLFGVTMALVQGVLIRWTLRLFGEWHTVVWGQAFDGLAFALLAVVTSGALALVLTPLAALGAVVSPALQGIMARQVSADEQGELQGVLTSVHALAMIVSPLLMAWVFAAFTRPEAPVHLPGAPFLLSLVLIVFGIVLFIRDRARHG